MDSRTIITELPRLRRYARAMLGDRAAADDLVQDTLERAWSRIAQWRVGSDLRAWLFGIMHNLRVDQLRRGTLTTHSLGDDACDVSTRATQTDRLEVMDLESALRQLPDDQREVLLLVALEEMSYADIAAALGIPIGTVMSRLSRGRERLRQIMEGQKPAANLRVVR
ncbi:MAG: sigma-70 family RNA polymerase sigma factor [Dechloromonas sp.]|nr:sigma-70 family RNA polymerase sigma factor [Dechloromonas sp.]